MGTVSPWDGEFTRVSNEVFSPVDAGSPYTRRDALLTTNQ